MSLAKLSQIVKLLYYEETLIVGEMTAENGCCSAAFGLRCTRPITIFRCNVSFIIYKLRPSLCAGSARKCGLSPSPLPIKACSVSRLEGLPFRVILPPIVLSPANTRVSIMM
jgi:hypothetical protein